MIGYTLGFFLSITLLYFSVNFFLTDFEKFKFIVTSIGAMLGFYVAYRRYERDKEIEIIDKYAKEYDLITLELNESSIYDVGFVYDKLLNIWYKEFYLYSRGYITDGLWKEWSYWIGFKLEEIFLRDIVSINIFTDRLLRYYDYGFINNHKWSVAFGGYYARINHKIGFLKLGEEDFYIFLLKKIKYLKRQNDPKFNKFLTEQLGKLGSEKLNMVNHNLNI